MTPLRQRVLDELRRRNYSPATTRGYIHAIKQFAAYFGKSPERLGGDEIRRFELHLLRERKLVPGTVEGRISALRFLYKKNWRPTFRFRPILTAVTRVASEPGTQRGGAICRGGSRCERHEPRVFAQPGPRRRS